MATKTYLDNNSLPAPGTNARLALQTIDNVNIGTAIQSSDGTTGLAIQLTDPTPETVDGTTLKLYTAATVLGTSGGIEILAAGMGTDTAPNIYAVQNSATIEVSGNGGYGIKVTDSSTAANPVMGALKLDNSGTISTTGTNSIAIMGGSEGDIITNHSEIKTAGSIAVDLGKGNDYYDGRSGTVIGKIVLGEGNDTAYGGDSSETFSGGAGEDIIDGGGSTDTVDYFDATSGITVNLTMTVAQSIGGGQGQDLLLHIENIIGSSFADTLTGDNGDNSLAGGQGDDTIVGGLGDDTLDGGEGSNDTLRFTGSTNATVDLSNISTAQVTGYGTDLLKGFENVEGGLGADKLTGNDSANKLSGNGGNDTLQGGKGDDTLVGGGGSDMAVFSGSRSDYTITSATSGGTITATVKDNRTVANDGTDQLTGIRLLKFADGPVVALTNANPTNITLSTSSISEDKPKGSFVASLSGSDPDGDTLHYSLLAESDPKFGLSNFLGTWYLVLNGTLDYETATSHQIIVKAMDNYGGEFTKTLTINVTNVTEATALTKYGTAGGEELVGENGNDQIFGLGGDDRLFGLLGNDTLYGGDGNDVVVGGNGTAPSGNDKLYGGTGNDTLYGGDGQDIFVFDTKPGKTNIDTFLDFSPQDDTIYLSHAIFKKAGKVNHFISKADFVIGSKIKDASDHIIYQSSTGALFYDADGTGKSKPVQIAVLPKHLHLTPHDFFVF